MTWTDFNLFTKLLNFVYPFITGTSRYWLPFMNFELPICQFKKCEMTIYKFSILLERQLKSFYSRLGTNIIYPPNEVAFAKASTYFCEVVGTCTSLLGLTR